MAQHVVIATGGSVAVRTSPAVLPNSNNNSNNSTGTSIMTGELVNSHGIADEPCDTSTNVRGRWHRITPSAPHRWVVWRRRDHFADANMIDHTVLIATDNRTRRVGAGMTARIAPGLTSNGNNFAANGSVTQGQNVTTTHRVTRNGRVWVRIGSRRWIHEAVLA